MRKHARIALLAVALTSVLFTVHGDCDPSGGAPAPQLQGAVLILLDTVRADHLSCYGHSRPTSPNIDALAQRGVRFAQTVSCSPWTLPGMAGLLAGEHPERAFGSKLKRSLVTRLKQAGYTTAAVTEGGYVSKVFGFDLGFDHYEEEEGAVQLLAPGQARKPSSGGIARTFRRAREWLQAHRDEKFFLLIHTYEPHTPYTNRDFTKGMDQGRIGPAFRIEMLNRIQSGVMTLTTSEREYVEALYDGDILNSDRQVGAFLELLETAGLAGKTLVVVTSDHGEELNDHYPAFIGDHGHSLRDPLLLVPLVWHNPLGSYAQKVVTDQVRLIDVMPTIAEELGVGLGRQVNGASLVPLMTGKETGHRSVVSGQTKTGPQRYSIRSQGYKFIAKSGPAPPGTAPFPGIPPAQLYDLAKDPGEHKNLIRARPKLARTLQQQLQREVSGMNERLQPEISSRDDAELVERLKSLGYLQ